MKNKTILIQGALDTEIEYIINLLQEEKTIEINGYCFFIGNISNKNVVVSKTLVGTINTAIAACIGIINFKPDVVINQGIAGSHVEGLHIGDIVIGEKCCNINSYKMPIKDSGKGSNPFEWKLSKRARDVKYADPNLIRILHEHINGDSKRQIIIGTLGSGDVHNREYDRIKWLNNKFDHLCEDMESIGAYSACDKFNVPCAGIRIISNNDLLSREVNKEIAIELQKKLINILGYI